LNMLAEEGTVPVESGTLTSPDAATQSMLARFR
jgi:hypothetical protein